ncbi:MAG: hypothetical protein R3C25_09520 [Hyphomonadaceae bacterium]
MEIVNGYVCRNCSEVELAHRFIDPSKPEAGPFGVQAMGDAAAQDSMSRLQTAEGVSAAAPAQKASLDAARGGLLDVTV